MDGEELEERGGQVGLGLLLAPVPHDAGPGGAGLARDLRADTDADAVEAVAQANVERGDHGAVVAHDVLGDLGLLQEHAVELVAGDVGHRLDRVDAP